MIQTICPECGSQMGIPEHYSNKPVVCVSCRKNFTASPLNNVSSQRRTINVHNSAENENKKTDSAESELISQKRSETNYNISSLILMLPSGLRQGAILGGWICFVLGIAAVIFSTYLFVLYVPLFIASFVLSVIAISQRNIASGVGLLLTTLIAPWVALTISFALHAKVSAKKEFKELQAKRAQYQNKIESMKNFEVIKANFFEDFSSGISSKRLIELSIHNKTKFSISRASFRGVLTRPGRSIPLIDDTFSYEISGGIEPGERVYWLLEPNMFSDWGRVPIDHDAEFKVTVIGLKGIDGIELFGDENFTKYDQGRLDMLEERFSER